MTQQYDTSSAITVLVAEDDADLREIIVFNIESQFNAKVIEAGTGHEAIEQLKKNKFIQFVVSDYNMPNGNGGSVYKAMKEMDFNVPFILCSTMNPKDTPELKADADRIHFAEKPDLQSINRIIYSLLQSHKPVFSKPEYVPISMRLLKTMGSLPNELYLKLSEGKFVKVMQPGDVFSSDEYEKYTARKIITAYVQNSHAHNFVGVFSSALFQLSEAKNLPAEQILDVSSNAISSSIQLLKSMGVTPEVQEMVQNSTKLALKAVSTNSELKSILDRFYNQKTEDDFLTKHSLLTGHLACWIASSLGWATEFTFQKLITAATLHDITLASDTIERLQLLDSGEAIDESTLSLDEKSFMTKHPEQAANLAKMFKQIPADVDTIILQHHERPDGTGFPGKINHTKISPLSAVFIVAHDLANLSLKFKGQKDQNSIVTEYKLSRPESFQFGIFKKIYSTL